MLSIVSLLLALSFGLQSCSHKKQDPNQVAESFVRPTGFYPDRDKFTLAGMATFVDGFALETKESAKENLGRLKSFAEQDGDAERANQMQKHLEAISDDFAYDEKQCRQVSDVGDQTLVAAYVESANTLAPDQRTEEEEAYFGLFSNLVLEFIPGPCADDTKPMTYPELQLPFFQLTPAEKEKYKQSLEGMKGEAFALKPPVLRGQGLMPEAATIGLVEKQEDDSFVIDSLCTKYFIAKCYAVFDTKGRIREVVEFQPNF